MGSINCLDVNHKRDREFVTKADVQWWEGKHGAIEKGEVVLKHGLAAQLACP